VDNPRRTRRWELRTPVPLEIVYRTAEVREGVLELHPDVYGRERTPLRERALDALRQAGVAEEMIEPVRLDSLVRAGRREHVRIEIDGLFRAPEPPPVGPPGDSLPAPALRERRRR
jgi:hypothetical protein